MHVSRHTHTHTNTHTNTHLESFINTTTHPTPTGVPCHLYTPPCIQIPQALSQTPPCVSFSTISSLIINTVPEENETASSFHRNAQ